MIFPPIPASLQTRYEVCVKHIPIGRWTTLDILTVRNPDALIDRIDPSEFARDERLPYWAEIWPSSVGMGLHLFTHPWYREAPALELGCGVGIAGIAAAKAGWRVDACDYEEDALAFARHNAARNRVAAQMTFRHLDWRRPGLNTRYRMIIGSDIVYERSNHPHLLAFLEATLAPDGAFLLSDPDRTPARMFVETMIREGYRHTAQPWRVQYEDATHRITVHRFIRHRS